MGQFYESTAIIYMEFSVVCTLYNNNSIVIYLISPWLHFYIYSTYVYLIIPLILPELQIFVSANIGKM